MAENASRWLVNIACNGLTEIQTSSLAGHKAAGCLWCKGPASDACTARVLAAVVEVRLNFTTSEEDAGIRRGAITRKAHMESDQSPAQTKSLDELMVQQVDHITARAERSGSEGWDDDVTGLRTEFHGINRMLCGLQPGSLTMVAGAAGMGRTAFVLNIATYVSREVPVLFFSFKESAEEIARRTIASTGRIDRQYLQIGALNDDEWTRLSETVDALSKQHLFVDDTPALTAEQLCSRAGAFALTHGRTGLIVVDGLGWLCGADPARSASDLWVRMEQAARSLKIMARELGCPVLLTADIKKDTVLQRVGDMRPMLMDLYGPASLQSIADSVLMIYRDDYYNHDSQEPGTAEIIIVKSNVRGTVKLAFSAPLVRFDNLPPRQEIDN